MVISTLRGASNCCWVGYSGQITWSPTTWGKGPCTRFPSLSTVSVTSLIFSLTSFSSSTKSYQSRFDTYNWGGWTSWGLGGISSFSFGVNLGAGDDLMGGSFRCKKFSCLACWAFHQSQHRSHRRTSGHCSLSSFMVPTKCQKCAPMSGDTSSWFHPNLMANWATLLGMEKSHLGISTSKDIKLWMGLLFYFSFSTWGLAGGGWGRAGRIGAVGMGVGS